MNVERLQILADAVRPGSHKFADDLTIRLNMATAFKKVYELGPHTHEGCLIAFTHLLFGERSFLEAFLNSSHTGPDRDDEINLLNLDIEASMLLGLDEDVAFELFYGTLNDSCNGENAYRVVRKLLITEEVDWRMIHDEKLFD